MSENKTGKYFKYAIGEILLVMIGILLALQVNNWNEERKSNLLARELLIEMKHELIQDTIDFNWNLSLHESILNAEKQLLKALRGREPSLPDTFSYSMALGLDPISVSHNVSIESLKNYGLNIIKNDELRSKISKLYDFYYKAIEEGENRSETFDFYNEKLEIFSKHFKLHDSITLGVSEAAENLALTHEITEITPIDFNELKQNNELQIVLSQSTVYRGVMIGLYKEIIDRVNELLELLNEELK
jgi:hypothetical protein